MAKQTFTTGQVLTAAQMTSLQQTAMLGGEASAKTASYTLVAADAGTAISMSNAGATTITVNTGLFAAGDTVHITNLGAGVCTITAGTATVNSSASLALAQYESGFLDFTSTSAAIFVKGAGAAPSSGGKTLLSTTTLSGASTTISGISQDYIDLQIIIDGVTNATANGNLYMKINGNNNSFYLVGQTASPPGIYDNLTQQYLNGSNSAYSRTSANNTWQVTINNYVQATNYKPISVYGQFLDSGGSDAPVIMAGSVNANAAITSILFLNTGGNFSTGTVKIYGVK